MYQLADNIAVSSPTIVNDRIDASGGKYIVAAGQTLTVNKQPLDGLDQLFDGPGAVSFGPDVAFARAEWFGAGKGADDGAIINKTIAAAYPSGGAIVKTVRDMNLTTGVRIDVPVVMDCRPSSYWRAYGVVGDGSLPGGSAVSVLAGTIGREGQRWVLPNIEGALYAGLYLEGARLMNIEVGKVYGNGWGVMFDLVDPTRPTINNDVWSRYIGESGLDPRFPNWTGAGVMFRALTPGALQGNKVHNNFSNNNRNHVHYFGQHPSGTNLDSNSVEMGTMDFCNLGPMADGTPSVGVRSSMSGPPGATFRATITVMDWCGGFHPTSVMLKGDFGGAKMYFNPANAFAQLDQVPGDMAGPWQFNANNLNNDVRFGQAVISDPAR